MIVYSAIARAKDAVVLAETSSENLMSGNAPQVTIELMKHLSNNPHVIQDAEMKTFVHNNEDDEDDFFSDFMNVCAMKMEVSDVEEYFFHLLVKDGVYYCCISDDPDTRDQKVNFAFLQQIQQEFTKQNRFRRVANANAYAMDKSFAPNFRSSIHYYNVNHSKLRQEQKVQAILSQVEDMKALMGRNIKLSMQRAGNLERLVKKSQEMEADIEVFRRRSKMVRKRKQRKYYRVYATLIFMVATVVYLITALACGWKLQCHATIQDAQNGN